MTLANAIEPDCKFEAGFMIPVIDPMRCEAKGPCVPICPYDVLAIRAVPTDEKAKLPFIGRIKLFVHGGKQAFAADPDACHGCGLCVQACPEKAIKLRRRQRKWRRDRVAAPKAMHSSLSRNLWKVSGIRRRAAIEHFRSYGVSCW